jgi:regulator of sirC expression with transglutaminase-like and TPR domain
VHAAVLGAIHGDNKNALLELEHVADTFPDSYEALMFAGMLNLQNGDRVKALEDLERFSLEAPPAEQPPMLGQFIQQLRTEVGPK